MIGGLQTGKKKNLWRIIKMGVFNKQKDKENIEDVDVMKDIKQKEIQLALSENENIQSLIMQISFEGMKGQLTALIDAMVDMKLKGIDNRLKEVETEITHISFNSSRNHPAPIPMVSKEIPSTRPVGRPPSIPPVYKSVEKDDYATDTGEESEEENEAVRDIGNQRMELEKRLRILKMTEGRMKKNAMRETEYVRAGDRGGEQNGSSSANRYS
jgi:hypothetical protein